MIKRNIIFRHYEEDDIEIIYQAYFDKSFNMPEMSKDTFCRYFKNIKSKYDECIIVEFDNKPIAFVNAIFDGWKYEPHVETFKCASKRELLYGFIAFFEKLSNIDTIGCVIVKCLNKSKNIFDHVCKRGFLQYIGIIQGGDYRGDEYIYATKGNAKFPSKTKQPTIGKL